jgi:hypothetical protein
MTREEVIQLMRSSRTEQEWNDNCNKVMKACDGYPHYWFEAIVSSGLMSTVTARFGNDDKIHIQPIELDV